MIDPTFATLVLGEPLSPFAICLILRARALRNQFLHRKGNQSESLGVQPAQSLLSRPRRSKEYQQQSSNSNSLRTIWVHSDNIALMAHCDWGLLMVLLAPVLVHISFALKARYSTKALKDRWVWRILLMLYLVLFIVVGKNIKLRVYRAMPCILGCLLINILIHRKKRGSSCGVTAAF